VVADQHGTPTTADSIAGALWALADRPDIHGITHWTDGGRATWHGFAAAIAEDARAAGLLPATVQVLPISTAEYPTPARRPANSVLDCGELIARLGRHPAPWRANLRATLAQVQ
jgi:dTDP-4-dehydrorhamnose reductase